jgi:hypothetical protein
MTSPAEMNSSFIRLNSVIPFPELAKGISRDAHAWQSPTVGPTNHSLSHRATHEGTVEHIRSLLPHKHTVIATPAGGHELWSSPVRAVSFAERRRISKRLMAKNHRRAVD